ncbi:helix-turn-helix domain-containing protein [Echinicola marina]|uniref:helix-turn-helix domain-containing protein n=1 Tax=Echinicola marina TaxID=2859768 RepID=UPI001CF623C5|nr:helix-turn-helix domain-containing protein [Echinicola marina]UCS93329.1 helix-turn-helix domain-containing protein [Echinicola marina]
MILSTYLKICGTVGASFWTIQNWMHSERWKESGQPPKPINEKAKELYKKGMSYNEVAKALKISRSTAFKYVKASGKGGG